MGFRIELKMRVADPYTPEVAPTISAAFQQFVEQYNSSVTECEVQILPEPETVEITLHQPEGGEPV